MARASSRHAKRAIGSSAIGCSGRRAPPQRSSRVERPTVGLNGRMAAGRRLMRFIGKAPRRDWDHRQLIPFDVSGQLAFYTRSGTLLAAWPMGVSIAARVGAQLAFPAPLRDLEPCSERATRGYPALFCELDPSKRSKSVQLSLLLIGSGSPGPIAFLMRSAVARASRHPVVPSACSVMPGP